MKKSNLKNKIKPLEIKDGKLSEKYLDTVGVIVVALDTKGKITFLNKKGCEILGYKKSEIIGKNWFDTCLPKNQKKQIKKVFKKIITGKGKQLKKYENFIITKKGEVKLVSWFNTNFVNDNVKIIGTLSSGEDITDQKKTEEMLLKSQRKISDIVEFFPDAVLAVNKEKEIIIWNKAIEKMSGIPASKMIGKGNYAYTITFYGERRPQLMDLVFKKNKKLSAKYKNIVRIGNTLTAEVFCNALYHNKGAWLSVKASPLHDESGNVIGAIESLRDITERKITEEVLKNQNLLINGISDNLDSAMIYQAIILKDGSRKFTYLSNSVKKFYGVSPENGMKNSNLLYSKFHKDDIKGLINAEEKAIRDFSTFRYEARVNDSLGNIRWSSFVSKPKKLEDGTICFDGIEFDISKIKKTEEKLKQSEERFHLLFENANDAIWLMNKNIFIDSNLKAVEMFGCKKKSEMVNRTPVNFSPAKQPDGQNSSKKAAKYIKLAFSGHPQRFYWQHKKKDGSLFDTEISLNRFILKGEVYLQAIGRDISDRKKAEEKLMLSEKKYHTLINLAVDGILLGSHEGIIMEANESMCVILGMAKKDFIGKHVSKLPFTKDSLKKYPLRFDLLKKGKVVITNRVFVRPNGTKVTVEMHSKMMPDGTYHSIYRDITKRQKIEQKIKENEEKYRLLFETANDGIAVIQDGLILYGNKAIGKMYGASVSKMIGHKFTEYIAKEEMSKLSQYYKMRVAGKNFSKMYETILMNKNGKRIYVELSAARIFYNNKPADHIILRNITERKQAEEKIIENEEKYRRLFESTKDSILILNAYSGEITDVNPFIEELLGYSKKELIGKKIFEINLFKDIIQNKKKFIELKEKKYVRYDNLTLQTKLGIKKYVEFVSNVYLVGTKKVIQCNIRDFTEKIQKEKELDQVKNDFLSLTSHQLRTPLSATKWVLEILKQDLHFLNLKQQQKFEDLIVSNERLINLVNRLLDVTRIESGKLVVNKKNVDLRKLIDDLCESFKILADNKKKNIKIIAPQNLKDIYCDPVLITEAIGNLLNNAINYSLESSKEIIIKIEDRKNDYLITIHNEGNIDPSSIKKIKVFNKFVRGKNALEIEPSGSGLGLYITKKVIEANGGDVWFESETKSGTNFYLVINKK